MDQRQAVSLWIAGCVVSLLTGIGLGYWVAVSVERQPFYQTTKIGWGDIEYVCVVDTRTGKIVRMANAIDARREAKKHERPTPPALQTRPPEGLPLTMSLEEFDAATEAALQPGRPPAAARPAESAWAPYQLWLYLAFNVVLFLIFFLRSSLGSGVAVTRPRRRQTLVTPHHWSQTTAFQSQQKMPHRNAR